MQTTQSVGTKSRFGLTPKLVSLLLVFALVPIAVIGISVMISFGDIKEQASTRFMDAAINIADKVDRNLFERYGDVQAFGLNQIIQNRENWYKPSDENAIAGIMNQYVSTYGIYYLTLLVDTKGNLIAVNSKDAGGHVLNTKDLYSKNFSNTKWFQALANRQYTTSMPFSAAGNTSATGTFIEDLHIDNDVKNTYPGNDAMTLGFSAPVYNKDGQVIAYWSNRAKFSLVEEIFQQAYKEFEHDGYPSTEMTLLDSKGRVIIDYDPALHNTTDIVHDLNNVLMKFNLAQKGVTAAQDAVAGKTGHEYAFHARKKIMQAAGYTHLKGALGYPGMNWSVLVRVPESEAAPWLSAIQRNVVLILVACAVVAALIGLYVGRNVIASILPVVRVATRAAEGDLRDRIEVKTRDEIGQMGIAFNKMLDQLNEMVAQVKDSATSISSGTIQIAEGNTSLSQRTEEQASSLEETASSMEEMTGTVKQNADSAAEAKQLADANRNRAASGAEVVSRTVQAMGEINESSTRIADIITTIDGIAFQTNLLALNAAVEAARAGEQGRGFAVVASEVRSLAQRSAEAAKEIKDLIEDSVGKVKAGTQLVDESGKTLEEIIEGTQKVADIIAEIAAASQEQASGIDQVNNAVTQMDNMTQDNAALVEEAAAASRSMQEQAANLSHMMEYFKLDSRYDSGKRIVNRASVSNEGHIAPPPGNETEKTNPDRTHLEHLQRTQAKPAKNDTSEWEQF